MSSTLLLIIPHPLPSPSSTPTTSSTPPALNAPDDSAGGGLSSALPLPSPAYVRLCGGAPGRRIEQPPGTTPPPKPARGLAELRRRLSWPPVRRRKQGIEGWLAPLLPPPHPWTVAQGHGRAQLDGQARGRRPGSARAQPSTVFSGLHLGLLGGTSMAAKLGGPYSHLRRRAVEEEVSVF
jgi:hypothetical protein